MVGRRPLSALESQGVKAIMDPIQVWENHAGPEPSLRSVSSYIYKLVAYRDAEADADRYGYGDTIEAAMIDYLEQEMEDICVNCDGACGQDPDASDECILIEPNRSAWLRQ